MRRLAFSLVELLVVIAIIGALMALLLPAIQSARESARQSACRSNLRQVALAVLQHEQQLGHFPYGGWGLQWVGMPDRGFGARQPGGWVYNILPYVEQGGLRDLGRPAVSAGFTERLSTPFSLFTCPTRRPCQAWPISPKFAYMRRPRPAGEVEAVARSDYAINSGATLALNWVGPSSIEEGDSHAYSWPDLRMPLGNPKFAFSGISHLREGVRMRAIEDGTSNTYLAGEKYLDPADYETGEALGDNESLYSGYCSDNHRFTDASAPPLTPAADGSLLADPRNNYRFGSPHPAGTLFAHCDGSVQLVAFDVNAEVHCRSGHISDGEGPVN